MSGRIKKKTQIENFMIIRPLGAELIHVAGQTDRHDETNTRFSEFFQNT